MRSNVESRGLASLTTAEKVRFGAFVIVVLAFLGLNFLMTPPDVLLAAFEGWGSDFGIHQVHDMTIAALIWLAFVVPMVLQLYRPTGRVNAILAPVLFVVPIAVMAYLAASFLFVGFAIGAVLALVALALHPAGRSVVRLDRVASVDRRLAALFAVGAIPLAAYGVGELASQLGPVDEHVLFVHFGAMAGAVFLVVVMGALAVYRRRDWRFAAWTAGLVAAFLGVLSLAFPSVESSLGAVGGGLVLLWSVAFVAGVERGRRGETRTVDRTDETAVEPA